MIEDQFFSLAIWKIKRLKKPKCPFVHPFVRPSQKIIGFKSMNSSVNSFLEWQKLLDIDESDYDLKKLIKNSEKWLKT